MLAAWLLSTLTASGCAPALKRVHTPEELRALIQARLPEVPASELILPFQVGEAALQRARALTAREESRLARAEALKDALFSEEGFGLSYAEGMTGTAEETLARGTGNCLSLAGVYVGLARGLGLKATFLDASARIQELRQEDGFLIRTGHVTAAVETEKGKHALDFASQLRGYLFLRAMDDLEAVAHFHNNRGYELILESLHDREAVPWAEVARRFRMATQVKPDFARAWSNLGVALARLEQPEAAQAAYRLAMLHDPDLPSPRTNLVLLLLAQGQVDAALTELDAALGLRPDDPRLLSLRAAALSRESSPPGSPPP
jgi:tetratricopeptide (TPR) repeat protein